MDEKLNEEHVARDRPSVSKKRGKVCGDSGGDKVLELSNRDKISAENSGGKSSEKSGALNLV